MDLKTTSMKYEMLMRFFSYNSVADHLESINSLFVSNVNSWFTWIWKQHLQPGEWWLMIWNLLVASWLFMLNVNSDLHEFGNQHFPHCGHWLMIWNLLVASCFRQFPIWTFLLGGIPVLSDSYCFTIKIQIQNYKIPAYEPFC